MIDSYVCLDLETTGLDPKKDKIIEIGAVRVRDGEIDAMLETFINPGRALDGRITELTGIVDKQLEDAPDISEMLPELLDFIGDDVLLGHSVLFDYSFVKRAAVNEKFSFEKNGIDTLKLARKFLPDLESRSLEFLCRHFEIEHSAHRAIADAKATSVLYNRLAELYYNGHEADFKPIPLKYNVKRETPVTIPQKNQLYKLLDRHKLKVDYNVEKLTRSEASRIIAQLLAEYGR
ncbi:MAG: 3'-5' exonuclease [Lachnospiraceae bacterium]|nr:3'-5' exonuclease [Lachnospiraceae bacterium]